MKEVVMSNKFELTGKIFNIWDGDKVTIINLFLGKRRSKKGDTSLTIPRILFYGENREKVKKFSKGDNISITAYISSKRNSDDKKVYYSQALVGYEIGKATNKMKETFGVDTVGLEYKNEGKIAGTITFIDSPKPNMIRFNVRVVGKIGDKDRVDTVHCVYFTKDVGGILSEIRRGDNVCLIASLSTKILETNKEKRHLENIYVSDLKKI